MSDTAFKAGDRVAEYLLLEKLGDGPLSEVWKARPADRLTPAVAIKLATHAQRFREARAMGTQTLGLDHPGVVRTLGLNIAHDPPYVVTEFVDGRSLRRTLAERGRLTAAEAVEIAGQLLDVLACAHERGVVHGNVKPENLLIENTHGKLRLRVTDFGPGMVGGGASPGHAPALPYLAPENRQGEYMNVRSDLFAAGVVLFEALAGRVPVGDELPSDAVEGVPVQLDGVVHKALRAQSDRRYATARDMQADLLACFAGARATHAAPAGATAGPQANPTAGPAGCDVRAQVNKLVDDVKGRQTVDIGRAFNDVSKMLTSNTVTLLIAGLLTGAMSLASLFLLTGPLLAGLYKMLLRVMRDHQTVQLGDLFASFDRFWSKALGYWVMMFAIVIATSFMFLPGLVVAGLTMYVLIVMVDRNLGFSEALNESARLAWKHGLFMHCVLAGLVTMMQFAITAMPHGGLLGLWLCLPVLCGLEVSAYLQVQEGEAAAPQPAPGVALAPRAA